MKKEDLIALGLTEEQAKKRHSDFASGQSGGKRLCAVFMGHNAYAAGSLFCH